MQPSGGWFARAPRDTRTMLARMGFVRHASLRVMPACRVAVVARPLSSTAGGRRSDGSQSGAAGAAPSTGANPSASAGSGAARGQRKFGALVKDAVRGENYDILKSFVGHLWPRDSVELRVRTAAAVLMLIVAKVGTVNVPLLFKMAIDELNIPETASAVAVVPVALLIGYGVARLATALFNEMRSAIFAKVAQTAIRNLSHQVRTVIIGHALSPLLLTRNTNTNASPAPADVSAHPKPRDVVSYESPNGWSHACH